MDVKVLENHQKEIGTIMIRLCGKQIPEATNSGSVSASDWIYCKRRII
jgi:hypothetical protein